MIRHLSLLVPAMVGVAAGAAGTALLRSDYEPVQAETEAVMVMPSGGVDQARPIDVPTVSASELSVSDRADLLGSLAQSILSDAAVLFETAARLSPSRQRSLLMSAAIARIAAEDPAQALTIASDSFLDARTARQVGLVLFDWFEPSLESIETIISALPQIDSQRFSVGALAQLAATAPDKAVDLALGLDDRSLGSDALTAVTRAWVGRDVQAALDYIDTVDDPVSREIVERFMMNALARSDRAAARAYIDSRYATEPTEHDRLLSVIGRAILVSDPPSALAIAEELRDRGRNDSFALGLERPAAAWLARRDPEAAKEYVRGLSDHYSNENQRSVIAIVLGEQDPDGAVAWLRTFEPIPEDLAGGVLEGIARVDPLRVIDLAEQLAGDSPIATARAARSLIQNAGTQQLSAAQIADRILLMEDAAQREEWLNWTTGVWANQNSEEVFNWLLGNQARVGETPFISLARWIGNQDPARALEYATQVPTELQDGWVTAALENVAEHDPAGAISLVSELRGRPVYGAAAATVASYVATSQPERAAVLLTTVSNERQPNVAEVVGRAWARRNLQAAELWAASLTAGATRDAALRGIVFGLSGDPPSPAIMTMFSSDDVRQQVTLDAVRIVARQDPLAAQGLIDQYVSDPSFRQRAEQYLLEASR